MKPPDGALKINVVLPERVIGVDEQSLRAILPGHTSNHSACGREHSLVELNAFNEKFRRSDYSHSPDVHFWLRSTQEDPQHDRLSREGRGFGELEGRSRPGPASGQVPARSHAVQPRRSDAARAATGEETGRCLRIPGKHLLAAERSGRPGLVPVAGIEHAVRAT